MSNYTTAQWTSYIASYQLAVQEYGSDVDNAIVLTNMHIEGMMRNEPNAGQRHRLYVAWSTYKKSNVPKVY